MPSHAADSHDLADPQLSSIERLALLIEQAEQRNADRHVTQIPEPEDVTFHVRTEHATPELPSAEAAVEASAVGGVEDQIDVAAATSAEQLAAIAVRSRFAEVLAGRAHGAHAAPAPRAPAPSGLDEAPGSGEPLVDTEEQVEAGVPIFAAVLHPATPELSESADSSDVQEVDPARAAVAMPQHPVASGVFAARSRHHLPRVATLVGALSFFATLSLGIASRPLPLEDWLLVGLGAFVALLPIAAAPLLVTRAPATRATAASILILAALLAPLISWNLHDQAKERAAAVSDTATQRPAQRAERAAAKKSAREVTTQFGSLRASAATPTALLLAINPETELSAVDLADLASQQAAFAESAATFSAWVQTGSASSLLESEQLDDFVARLSEWVRLQDKLIVALDGCLSGTPPVTSAASCIGSQQRTIGIQQRWAKTVRQTQKAALKLSETPSAGVA